MKTIKTKLAQKGTSLYLKALIFGTVSGGVCVILLLCLFSLFLIISGTLPHELLIWFGIGISCISSFISGNVSSRITKVNGMLTGCFAGLLLFLVLFISGLATGNSLSYITLIKLILNTLCGAIGGIKGVNKKEKLHIK